MSRSAADERLLRVSKSTKDEINGFKAGVHLEKVFGRPIDDLHAQAVPIDSNSRKHLLTTRTG
ncbi:MAG: hypothetical protein H0T14_08170 [Nocardioidaceae bacterium]|nr:hypothetical protein [Nocardioidaceae bacterium]